MPNNRTSSKVPSNMTSSRASRVRTAWFLLLVSLEKGIDLHIGWKYTDGSVGFYSSSSKKSKSRPPWGSIKTCKFRRLMPKKELEDHLVFLNRRWESKAFNLSEFNPALWKVNDFTSKLIEMRAQGKDELLALYLSLMTEAEMFSHHAEGKNDSFGFRLGETAGDTYEKITSMGGSIDEYKDFLDKAIKSAMKVNKLEQVMGNVEGVKKRKNCDGSDVDVGPRIKKSKADLIKEDKLKEVQDKDGIEQAYIGKYYGRSDIPLCNLTNSGKVKMLINPLKVAALAKRMEERMDPALLVLTVCPAEGRPFDENNIPSNLFEVIHGRHRLMALQQLDQKGSLVSLVGMENKLVTCYIVRTECAIQANYAALRGNELGAAYVRKPFLHELVFIMEGLMNHYSQDKVEETVGRYGKLLEFGHDELTALRKLSKWPLSSLSSLCLVFRLFENFQTGDAKYLAKRQSSKIMSGSSIAVPNILFKKVAKMPSEYFDSVADKVIAKDLSLKEAADGHAILTARSETMSLIVKEVPGGFTKEEIVASFSTKLTDENLDSFSGAVIGEKCINDKGKALKDFCSRLQSETEVLPKAVFREVDSFNDIDFSSIDVDTLVINCRRLTEEQVSSLKITKMDKPKPLNLILLFGDQDSKNEALWKMIGDTSVKEVFFLNDKPKIYEVYNENLVYGIISAPTVYNPPLCSFNGPISNLVNVVNKLSPPGGKSLFFNEGGLEITNIHKEFGCTYYAAKVALAKFQRSLRRVSNQEVIVEETEDSGEEKFPGKDKESTSEIQTDDLNNNDEVDLQLKVNYEKQDKGENEDSGEVEFADNTDEDDV